MARQGTGTRRDTVGEQKEAWLRSSVCRSAPAKNEVFVDNFMGELRNEAFFGHAKRTELGKIAGRRQCAYRSV